MYSMSTETIETLPHFDSHDVYFLPLAPRIVYDFIEHIDITQPVQQAPVRKPTEQPRLLSPTQLEPGKLYEMIVSDAYGLRRYHTADLFLCIRKIRGLPDLAFQKRRGLEYSFTGEKLTAEQVSIVFEQLRRQYPNIFAGRYLTCVPVHLPDSLPHYNIFLIGDRSNGDADVDVVAPTQLPPTLPHNSAVVGKENDQSTFELRHARRSPNPLSHDSVVSAAKNHADLHAIAVRCDQLLSEINCEYRSKRASGRLGAVTFIETGTKEFAEQFATHNTWETQFKFLPLCPHLICDAPLRVS
jgi:hypothetical protein